MQVRFRSREEIEAGAQHLLDCYAVDKGWRPAPPIPIERLINYLGLRQEITDLYSVLEIPRDGNSDLLGALSFSSKQIWVHSEVDPDDYPWREGRYYFTLAHEVGHWVLHRDEHATQAQQGFLFGEDPQPGIVCRRSDRREPIEIQANRFASCLLLPSGLVRNLWQNEAGRTGTLSPDIKDRIVRDLAGKFGTSIEATIYRLQDLCLIDASHQPDLGV